MVSNHLCILADLVYHMLKFDLSTRSTEFEQESFIRKGVRDGQGVMCVMCNV